MRLIGLEPTRLATPDPKSGAYTNFATGAFQLQKYIMCHDFQRKGRTFFVQWWRICIFVIQTLCRYELCPVVSLRYILRFALPLSGGAESLCEAVHIALTLPHNSAESVVFCDEIG